MEKNNDPHVIVMDRDKFERLFSQVESTTIGDEIVKHVCRFNPHYRAELVAMARREQEEVTARRDRVRNLVKRKLNQTVYYRLPNFRETVLRPVRVAGRSENKLNLRVENLAVAEKDRWRKNIDDVDAHWIVEELPEGWQKLVAGPNKGCFMSSNLEDYEKK